MMVPLRRLRGYLDAKSRSGAHVFLEEDEGAAVQVIVQAGRGAGGHRRRGRGGRGRGTPGAGRGTAGGGPADHDTDAWATYKPDPDAHGAGLLELWRGGEQVEVRKTDTSIAHNFVLSVDFHGEDVWVGTAHGLSLGTRAPAPVAPEAP